MDRPEASRRPTAAAWAASLLVHSLLTAGALWQGLAGGTEAGGEHAEREVGIVLRQESRPPSPFDTDSPVESEATEPTQPTEQAPVELPPSPFSEYLSEVLAPPQPEGPGQAPEAGAGGGGSPPPTGAGRVRLPIGQSRVPFFGIEGVGSRFVFALDRSDSMRRGRLRAAKAELIASLDAIGPANQFNVLFFNTSVSTLNKRTAFGTELSKRKAESFIRGVGANGGTDRLLVLLHAMRLRPDVIFFLTDDDTPMAPGELDRIVSEAAGGVTIHTVEFGHGPDHEDVNFLSELADRTGGQRVYIDTSLLPR